MQPFILLGDTTSHGGKVLTGSPFSDCDGKPIARVGDMVSCPKCKGVFPIAEGNPSFIDHGVAAAYHGCKTACGATLISSQVRMLMEPTSGAAPNAGDGHVEGGIAPGFGALGAGMAAAYQDKPRESDAARFQGRFQLVSIDTGEPIAGKAVRVRSTSGQYMTGTTDADGFTQWVERDAAEALAFDLQEPSA